MNKKMHFMEGERVAFRPFDATTDIAHLHQWYNDPEVTYYLETGLKPTSLEQVRVRIDGDLSDPANVIFMIVDRKTNAAIGTIGLYATNWIARKAEMRIIIGDKDFWGKGYGTEALELITYYAFDRLNLNKVGLGVSAGNLGAKRAYEKAGYAQEGVLRDDVYRNNQYYDGITMAMLRADYLQTLYSKHKERFSIQKK